MESSNAIAPVLGNFRLEGRTALVTGAGAGIGAAIASALAEAGAEVVMVSLSAAELDKVAGGIAAMGGRVQARQCDVTDIDAVRKLIADIPELDIVVNNAGTNIPEPFTEVTEEHLDFMSNLNVRATFLVSQTSVKKMLTTGDRSRRGGVVINITSQMGHIGSPNRTVYCMNKHAIEGLTKALAVELAETGIRVNSVAPTFVDTPLVRKIVDTPEKRDYLVSRIPMGRMAQVQDIAAAVLYLASPAAAMVTGTSLLVDGGWTAQ
ncbi:glucose 1-dehydrogenase [Burkholderia sp. Ax-1719]|uniref:SDR family NAD(P)-dependent oxidoreductase n=1 Tax=Burkholderia sp. Ax-1719 TaxID=2608334 RepID=UPI001421A230|nr:glucose 1-dehydrogenase [Burkholderia sp. Ax-1719]NIE63099.1 glucose 1-dehydrogenase [Burkholderia sp. Ax-1719]